jgi:hypothetical protein
LTVPQCEFDLFLGHIYDCQLSFLDLLRFISVRRESYGIRHGSRYFTGLPLALEMISCMPSSSLTTPIMSEKESLISTCVATMDLAEV